MQVESSKLQAALREWGVEIRSGQLLAGWTSLAVGGRTDILMVHKPECLPELVEALQAEGLGWRLLGGGSNLLVQDGELPWVAVHLAGRASQPTVEGSSVTVRAAADLGRTVTTLARQDLGGMEGLIGVPGSVGGALRMNAGAYGMDIGQYVQNVTVYRGATNSIETVPASEAGFVYRSSAFANGDILLAAELELLERSFDDIRAEIKTFNHKRRASQPVNEKSAGCIFKNPPGASTGKMIDELGLKGFRRGGAVVSERHANFFVNRFQATADDLFALIDTVKERVGKAFGFELEEEVVVWAD
jgi:UDP-N-acetylmuramate dehydrogenase